MYDNTHNNSHNNNSDNNDNNNNNNDTQGERTYWVTTGELHVNGANGPLLRLLL